MSEQMIFCLGEGPGKSEGAGFQKNLRIFNVPVSQDVFNKVKKSLDIKNFELPITKWIDKKDIPNPTKEQSQMGGYLKELSYENAWKEMWSGMSSDDRSFIRNLPNFDAKIFEGITGIKIEDEVSLKGKEVEVKLDGKTYKAIIQ